MYADSLAPDRGAPGFRNRGPGGKPNERYSRQIDELDYIVPRGGYYFEVGRSANTGSAHRCPLISFHVQPFWISIDKFLAFAA